MKISKDEIDDFELLQKTISSEIFVAVELGTIDNLGDNQFRYSEVNIIWMKYRSCIKVMDTMKIDEYKLSLSY